MEILVMSHHLHLKKKKKKRKRKEKPVLLQDLFILGAAVIIVKSLIGI